MQESFNEKAKVIWLYGLSGSGKTTLAHGLAHHLAANKTPHYLLDGDVLRLGLNKDLGFSEADRTENLRRAAELAKILKEAGVTVICSFITPTSKDRLNISSIIGKDFFEVYVKCSIEECERRDVKGLYFKARQKELPNFTGVSAPFEIPENNCLFVDTERESYESCISQLIQLL
jgi:adenylyl-sulfate kinase